MVDDGGDLPGIEVVGSDVAFGRQDGSEVEVRADRPSWNPFIAVVVVLALLVVAAVVATSGDDDDDRADADPSTTAPNTTTTELSSTTSRRVEAVSSDGFLLDEPRPVFGDLVHASLLFGSVTDGWKLLDLDTGLLRSIRALERQDPITMLPVAGGLVFAEPFPSSGFVQLQFLPLPARSSALLPTEPEVLSIESSDSVFSRLFNVDAILHAGSSRDTFWMLSTSADPSARDSDLQATLLDISGQVLVGPFDIEARPRAATERGLIFDAGGHSYYVTDDGVTDLGPGRTFAAAATTIARATCDSVTVCRAQVLDVESGESYSGGPLPLGATSIDFLTMVLSDDGALVTVDRTFDISTPRAGPVGFQSELNFTLPNMSRTHTPISGLRTPPAWLPEDAGLVVLNGLGLGRFVISPDGVSETGRIAGLRVGSASALFVIPDE